LSAVNYGKPTGIDIDPVKQKGIVPFACLEKENFGANRGIPG